MWLGELRRLMRRHGGFQLWMIPWWVYALAVGVLVGIGFFVYAVANAILQPAAPADDPWGQPAVAAAVVRPTPTPSAAPTPSPSPSPTPTPTTASAAPRTTAPEASAPRTTAPRRTT
ncbi:MAG TPA: hypothetical protein GXZ45_06955, partial [Propionibacterium sp.]|nr:hypothetical protein [Propionibacterium sp.]